MFDAAQNKPSTRSGSVRLCGDLTYFEQHVESRAKRKNSRPCEACGADSYTIFVLFNVPLHFLTRRGWQTKKTCFLKFHSDAFFGLSRSDSTLLGKTKNEWKEPSKQTFDRNAGYVKSLQAMNMESYIVYLMITTIFQCYISLSLHISPLWVITSTLTVWNTKYWCKVWDIWCKVWNLDFF